MARGGAPRSELVDLAAALVASRPNDGNPLEDRPVTSGPDTDASLENRPVTGGPDTDASLENRPVTVGPDTDASLDDRPVTVGPDTATPVTAGPVTARPDTDASLEDRPVTVGPVTATPVTVGPVTATPVTIGSLEDRSVADTPITARPDTDASLENRPVTAGPVTGRPASATPVTIGSLEDRSVAGTPITGGAAAGSWIGATLSAAVDERTRLLVDGFVHANGPAPARFAWVALGSHARGELHCASDQDHALVWADERAAAGSYAHELADTVINGLAEFGMRRCDGGYMADRWSLGLAQWLAETRDRIEEPTPQAVLDLDVFLDLRPVSGDLDVTPISQVLVAGADSARLLHGLAASATSFQTPLVAFGRLPHGLIDLKRSGLAPLVLLARLYGLQARSTAVATVDRLAAAADAGLLSAGLVARLRAGFEVLAELRLAGQVAQFTAGLPITDRVGGAALTGAQRDALRDAFRAIKATQSVTAVTFRTGM